MLFEFRLRDFFVLRTFSETIYASWSQKEEISRSMSSTSTSVLDSISRCESFGIPFVLQQFRASSTCCILILFNQPCLFWSINFHCIFSVFFNVHIMNVHYAKFQKKFDSRTISRELPENVSSL